MKSELEMNYLQVLASQENVSDASKLKCQVLETLIINKLLIAKAEIDSVTVEKFRLMSSSTEEWLTSSVRSGQKKSLSLCITRALMI